MAISARPTSWWTRPAARWSSSSSGRPPWARRAWTWAPCSPGSWRPARAGWRSPLTHGARSMAASGRCGPWAGRASRPGRPPTGWRASGPTRCGSRAAVSCASTRRPREWWAACCSAIRRPARMRCGPRRATSRPSGRASSCTWWPSSPSSASARRASPRPSATRRRCPSRAAAWRTSSIGSAAPSWRPPWPAGPAWRGPFSSAPPRTPARTAPGSPSAARRGARTGSSSPCARRPTRHPRPAASAPCLARPWPTRWPRAMQQRPSSAWTRPSSAWRRSRGPSTLRRTTADAGHGSRRRATAATSSWRLAPGWPTRRRPSTTWPGLRRRPLPRRPWRSKSLEPPCASGTPRCRTWTTSSLSTRSQRGRMRSRSGLGWPGFWPAGRPRKAARRRLTALLLLLRLSQLRDNYSHKLMHKCVSHTCLGWSKTTNHGSGPWHPGPTSTTKPARGRCRREHRLGAAATT
mmetsp:Transcript_6372/g.16273  ORF Transcript_6372/g.16273 Transcript_6372/m.16273 type:complete len:464 (-) Transcript_6372:75-1466(-)